MYEARVNIFHKWLNEQCQNEELSTKVVARFLVKLFNDGKTPSTIEGYRTALSDAYPDYNWSTNRELFRLIKSFHRDRPRALRQLPSWDLRLVLQYLMGPHFEPMSVASFKMITLKTVFLLSLASGSRRSEVHSWLHAGVKFSNGYSEASLMPSLDFLAKNQKASGKPSEFSPCIIPALSKIVDRDLPDRSLCPVRALRFYLSESNKVRNNRKKLFIAYKPGYDKEISPITISTWLKLVIKLAYQNSNPDDLKLLKIKAHQVRSLASSWALLGGVSLTDIMNACHWSTHNTFTNFYLQPLAWSDGDSFSLGPFITAQHKVDF